MQQDLNEPMTGKFARLALPGVPITLYRDLATKPLRACVGSKGRGLVFFTVDQDSPADTTLEGHWLALIDRGSEVEVFDPYGGTSDPWNLTHTFVDGGAAELARMGEPAPLVEAMLARSGRTASYNSRRFQRLQEGVGTCGFHCLHRLRHWDLGDDEYAAQVSRDMHRTHTRTPDAMVAALENTGAGEE